MDTQSSDVPSSPEYVLDSPDHPFDPLQYVMENLYPVSREPPENLYRDYLHIYFQLEPETSEDESEPEDETESEDESSNSDFDLDPQDVLDVSFCGDHLMS